MNITKKGFHYITCIRYFLNLMVSLLLLVKKYFVNPSDFIIYFLIVIIVGVGNPNIFVDDL